MAISFGGYEKGTLLVQFDGGEVYQYSNVPEDVADGFRWADAVGVSAGVYFHRYIKPRFNGVKIK